MLRTVPERKILGAFAVRGLKPTASASLKAFDRWGASPHKVYVTKPLVESNRVFARRGGKQLEAKDQSVG